MGRLLVRLANYLGRPTRVRALEQPTGYRYDLDAEVLENDEALVRLSLAGRTVDAEQHWVSGIRARMEVAKQVQGDRPSELSRYRGLRRGGFALP